MAKFEIDIAVVTHNSFSQVENLLVSLWGAEAGRRAQQRLYLIDAGSSDLAQLLNLPSRKLLTTRNYGFGTCANEILKHASTDIVALLNPDTEASYEALRIAAESFMETDTPVGGLELTDGHGNVLTNPVLSPRDPHQLLWPNRKASYRTLLGAALLINRNRFFQLGGFDTKFFLYGEETELCARVTDLGFDLPVFTSCQVVHLAKTGSSNVDPSWRLAQQIRGKCQFHRTRHGMLAALAALGLECVRCVRDGSVRPSNIRSFLKALFLNPRGGLPWPPHFVDARTGLDA